MKEIIQKLSNEIKQLQANSLEEVESLRIKYLSKKGEVSVLFDDFRNVPNEQKREIGQLLNELKNNFQDKINTLKDTLSATNKLGAEKRFNTHGRTCKIRDKTSAFTCKTGNCRHFQPHRIYSLPKVPKLKTTGTCSARLIFLRNIRQEICRILFSLKKIPTFCFAHTPHRYKPA